MISHPEAVVKEIDARPYRRDVLPTAIMLVRSRESVVSGSGHVVVANPVLRLERNILWDERPWPDAGELQSRSVDVSGPWQKWFAKLESLHELKPGWNGYTAPVPSDTALQTASIFLAELQAQGFEPTRLAPSAMGGVAITRRQGDRKGFVEFYNDGTVYALFSIRSGQMISKAEKLHRRPLNSRICPSTGKSTAPQAGCFLRRTTKAGVLQVSSRNDKSSSRRL
jgi:hypothetical protein